MKFKKPSKEKHLLLSKTKFAKMSSPSFTSRMTNNLMEDYEEIKTIFSLYRKQVEGSSAFMPIEEFYRIYRLYLEHKIILRA